jgi:hypothetical protein
MNSSRSRRMCPAPGRVKKSRSWVGRAVSPYASSAPPPASRNPPLAGRPKNSCATSAPAKGSATHPTVPVDRASVACAMLECGRSPEHRRTPRRMSRHRPDCPTTTNDVPEWPPGPTLREPYRRRASPGRPTSSRPGPLRAPPTAIQDGTNRLWSEGRRRRPSPFTISICPLSWPCLCELLSRPGQEPGASRQGKSPPDGGSDSEANNTRAGYHIGVEAVMPTMTALKPTRCSHFQAQSLNAP